MRLISLTFLSILLTASSVFPRLALSSPDKQALTIADASVAAMGGRENYNNTRYLSWLFFGVRFHVWDKYTGDIRIEYDKGNLLLMNIHSKKGRVWENGQEILDKSLLQEKLKWGYKVWINDSYWVVMPFKLHDPGVVLTYARADKSLDGKDVHVLTMSFNDVGVTPDNKYEVFIDVKSNLITEFSYYRTVETKEPRFRLPWTNWQPHGSILLADSRGKRSVAPLKVYDTLPAQALDTYGVAKDSHGKTLPGAIIQQ